MSDTPTPEPGPPETPQVNPKDYDLRGQLRGLVNAANRSPDVVSMLVLGKDMDHAEGAIVVLRGRQAVQLFEQWAIRNRVLTPGRSDGLLDAVEGRGR